MTKPWKVVTIERNAPMVCDGLFDEKLVVAVGGLKGRTRRLCFQQPGDVRLHRNRPESAVRIGSAGGCDRRRRDRIRGDR